MKLYRREKYLKRIRPFYHDTDLIKVITGIRRCGKSYLLNEIYYDYLIKTNAVKFNPDSKEAEAIQTSIETWIKINREDAKIEKKHSWDNNWQTYYYSLAAKSAEREEIDNKEGTGYTSRLVPEACTAALFSNPTVQTDKEKLLNFITSAFDVGGVFHE